MQRRQAFSFSQLARQQAGFLRFFPASRSSSKLQDFLSNILSLDVYSAKISVLFQQNPAFNRLQSMLRLSEATDSLVTYIVEYIILRKLSQRYIVLLLQHVQKCSVHL